MVTLQPSSKPKVYGYYLIDESTGERAGSVDSITVSRWQDKSSREYRPDVKFISATEEDLRSYARSKQSRYDKELEEVTQKTREKEESIARESAEARAERKGFSYPSQESLSLITREQVVGSLLAKQGRLDNTKKFALSQNHIAITPRSATIDKSFLETHKQRQYQGVAYLSTPTKRQEIVSSLVGRIKEQGGLFGQDVYASESMEAIVPSGAKVSEGFSSNLGSGKSTFINKTFNRPIQYFSNLNIDRPYRETQQWLRRNVTGKLFDIGGARGIAKIEEKKADYYKELSLRSFGLPKYDYRFKGLVARGKQKTQEFLVGGATYIRKKPLNVVTTYVAGAGVSAGLSYGGAYFKASKTAKKLFKGMKFIQTKYRPLVYKSPQYIIGGLYGASVGVRTYQQPKGTRAGYLGKVVMGELAPFVAGAKTYKAIEQGLLTKVSVVGKVRTKSANSVEITNIKQVGKKVKIQGNQKVTLKTPREDVITFKSKGNAQDLVLQDAKIRTKVLGQPPQYYDLISTVSKGRPTGVIKGQYSDIAFTEGKKGIYDIKYLTKGKSPTLIKQSYIKPTTKGLSYQVKRGDVMVKPIEYGVDYFGSEGGSKYFYKRGRVFGIQQKFNAFAGSNIKINRGNLNLRQRLTTISGVSKSGTLQVDLTSPSIKRISEGFINYGKTPTLNYKIVQVNTKPSTIEYVDFKPARPKTITEFVSSQGTIMKINIQQPPLTTYRETGSRLDFTYSDILPRVRARKSILAVFKGIDKRANLLLEPPLLKQKFSTVYTQKPQVKIPSLNKVNIKGVLSTPQVSQIISTTPKLTPLPITLPKSITQTKTRSISQTKIPNLIKLPKTITKTNTKTLNRTIVNTRTNTRTLNRTFIRTITPTITDTIQNTKTITKTATGFNVARLPKITAPPHPTEIITTRVPKIPDLFFSKQMRITKKPIVFPRYKPSVLGIDIYKMTGKTIKQAPKGLEAGGLRLPTNEMIVGKKTKTKKNKKRRSKK